MTIVSNWSNYPKVNSKLYGITSKAELSQKLKLNGDYIVRGNGRCYGDASLNDSILSCLPMNKFLSFDTETGIIEVQSGVLLDDILKVTVPKHWFLPVTPGTKFITIGGAVASDVHGKNHHLEGSISNHIISLEIMLADGSTVSCSRTNNKDLFWATCGGMGLTGIILSVKFMLKPIKSAFIAQKSYKAQSLDEILELFERTSGSTYSVAWIDCLKGGKHFGRSLLFTGEHYDPGSGKVKLKEPFKTHSDPIINIPFNFPGIALNKYTIKLFNMVYYNKLMGSSKESIDHYDPFFYPLDAILNWNRMYGKRGFTQYQFVLPISEKKGLEKILRRIQSEGMGSFLAVLKVFGEQNDLISFPMKGYTLALDFAIHPKLFSFLNELDEMVLSYGGRIYMTKDSRMNKDFFWKSYSRLEEFVEIIKKYNPEAKINSLLSKRLEII